MRLVALLLLLAAPLAVLAQAGKPVYDKACVTCHGAGVAGAPKFGAAPDWAPRIARGAAALYKSALEGTAKGMPAKGGRSDLSDAEVKAAVDYMIAAARGSAAPAAAAAKPVAAAPASGAGRATYEKACGNCHATGLAGAPRYGNAQEWAPRVARGTAALYKTALEGNLKGMPPRGGRSDLSDAEVKAGVDYMLAAVRESARAAPAPATAAAPASATIAAASIAPPPAPAPVAERPAVAAATSGSAAAEVNAFNRLLRPLGARNAPPTADGIHDPQHEGTIALQPPLASFELLPKSTAGNRVNWVAALNERKIAPRWDRVDGKAQAVVMDLNIVREVKGTMPDVLFPHKQHTEWLDCSNCHPAIFIPQKGANQISMAAILLGQKCGVCHGKVAFPVSDCRSCHSQKKDVATAATQGGARK
jgi:c(7)-type cytochrome triheme protein